MPVPSGLRYFQPAEFKHPELVEVEAAHFLDDVRAAYGQPLVVTSDARTPEENAAASGSSPTSWHLQGRAFDLKWITNPAALWRFVRAVYQIAGNRGVELELVNSATDKHIHLALLPVAGGSRLLIRAD